MAEVFYSYAAQDRPLRDELEKHLSIVKRQGLISSWHDREILPGKEWAGEIHAHLDTAHIILLLISPDFLASDYCYDIEMERALERHKAKGACVIPIMLRPVDWSGAPFKHLQALPTDGKPVSCWKNRDQAFLNIAQGIRKVIKELTSESVSSFWLTGDTAGAGSGQEENDTNTCRDSGKYHIKSDSSVQGQVIGDYANVHIYLNGSQNVPHPSQKNSSSGNDHPQMARYQGLSLPQGTPIYMYDVHSNKVVDVAWSPDGMRIVSTGCDGTVRICDAAGNHLSTHRMPFGPIFSAWFNSHWVRCCMVA